MSLATWMRKRATVYELDEDRGIRGDWEDELSPLYSGLSCCDIPISAEERAMHGSTGVEVTHVLWFPFQTWNGILVEIPEKARVRINGDIYDVVTVQRVSRAGLPARAVKVLAREVR